MLAVGVGIHKHELDRVTQMYADLGSRIFSKMRSSGSDEQQSYSKALRDRLDSLYTSGQQAIHVGVTGSKHDPTLFESLVRQECAYPPRWTRRGRTSPRSSTPVSPDPRFSWWPRRVRQPGGAVFELRVPRRHGRRRERGRQRRRRRRTTTTTKTRRISRTPRGRWAVASTCCGRASGTPVAPYYLADYGIGDERWQDGAVTQQSEHVGGDARRLWPDRPIDVVSLGTGIVPTKRGNLRLAQRHDDGHVHARPHGQRLRG